MVKGITIDTSSAASPHIYAYDQALINNAIIGGDAVHEMFGNLLATKVSNNIVTIAPGAFSIQGHFGYVQHGTIESMTIDNGTAGQKRNDLICAKFKRTIDTDVISLVVVKGTNDPTTPVDPTITQQDLLTGGTERLLPLWRVSIDGINITTLTQLFAVQKNLNAFKDGLAVKNVDGWLVQDINGFRTSTLRILRTLNPNLIGGGVYYVEDTITIPVGARVSTDLKCLPSAESTNTVSVQTVSYNNSTGALTYRVYSHVNYGGFFNLTVSFVITGGI